MDTTTRPVSSTSTLEEVGDRILAVNITNGFVWEEHDIPTIIALCHSEVSEAFQEMNIQRRGWFDHLAEELADVQIRAIDCLKQLNMPLHNDSRPFGHLPAKTLVEDWTHPQVEDNKSNAVALLEIHNQLTLALEVDRNKDKSTGGKAGYENAFSRHMLNVIWMCLSFENLGFPVKRELIRKIEKNATRGFKHGNKAY